jgi:hypothetical protein
MRHRLVPVVLLVIALLAIVALAARGRPLGASAGTNSGLPITFWNYVFTTLVIGTVILAMISLGAYFFLSRGTRKPGTYQSRTAKAVGILLVICVLLAFVGRHINLQHLFHPNAANTSTATNGVPSPRKGREPAPASHNVQFQWPELAVILGALVVLGVVAARRSRVRPALAAGQSAPEVLAAALDESLDDLRAEPDLRQAIVAAYARMETVLAAAGLPRRPAEAPLEYVERALLELDTSAAAVRRLTDLFEWARFSHHEPESAMRDEAIDALVAVRDELRAAERVAA